MTFADRAGAEFEYLTQWGAPKGRELVAPFDVERDAAGNAYVVDFLNRGVHKFNAANNFVAKWGSFGTGPGQFVFSTAIGRNETTGDVYVADISGLTPTSFNSRIERFDSNGNFVDQFGSAGTAEGKFGFVRGISVDPSGNVFVADSSNNRIQEFDAGGTFVRMWGKDVVPGGGTGFEECISSCKRGEAGTAEGEFAEPTDVAVSGFGIFVSDTDNNRIQRFNLAGGHVNFLVMGGRDVVPGGIGGYETCSMNCKQGASGSANGELEYPQGLDVNDSLPGHVWVADGNNNRVQRYNLGLTYEAQFGSQGPGDGQFESPGGLAEGQGQVVVTDQALFRTQRFNGIAGTFQSRFGEPGDSTLVVPQGIGAGPGGVYVTDSRDRVTRFGLDGTLLSFWGGKGTIVGRFLFPAGVATAPGGQVYVVDRGNSRVQRFSASGAALGAWGSSGTASGQFEQPRDVAVDSNGRVYVVEENNNRVQKFTSIGGFLGTWGALGSANGQFEEPSGIATDRRGNVYVADTDNNRVQKFDASGNFRTTWGSQGSGNGEFDRPSDLAIDSLGNVFVADTGNNRIQRFDSSGEFLGRWGAHGGDGTAGVGPGKFFQPTGVSVSGAGNIYVLDSGNGRVQEFAAAEKPPPPRPTAPTLHLGAKKRQRVARLKAVVRCGGPPCKVRLSGKVVAKRRSSHGGKAGAKHKVVRRLKPAVVVLDPKGHSKVRLKLRKRKRSLRKINRVLAHGGRGAAIVHGRARNEAGKDKATRRVKLKRRH